MPTPLASVPKTCGTHSTPRVDDIQLPTRSSAVSPAGTFALAYAAKGYHVFPCGPDKKPLTEHGFKDASTDAEVVRAFWECHPDAQVGVDCGRTGIAVVDLDKKNGKDGVAAFEALRGAEPHGCALIVSSPSGGRHFVYQAVEGVEIKSTASQIAPGIDTRASGGYIIVPSPASPGRESIEGEFLELSPSDLAQPPAWLMAILPRVGALAVAGSQPAPHLTQLWQGASEGARNCAATQIAGKLLAHGLRDEAWPLLVAWNGQNNPPLAERELRGVYESVLRGDQQRHPDRHATLVEGSLGLTTAGAPSPFWIRQTLDEVLATTLHPWVVQHYFRAGQLGFVCAFPTVGKSTLVASWIMATLYGRKWGGRRVKGGSVVVLVGEGRRGFANRLAAYRRRYGLGPPPDGRYIEIVDFKLPLSSPAGQAAVRLLIETITKERGHAPTMVVIDTLSSHWAESEDSAEFGAPAMRALADIAQVHACVVIVVHHVTKAKGKFVMPELVDIRGSSSFAGNTDFVFAMCATKDDTGVLLCGLKLKDDETPPEIELQRVSVQLGQDEEGEPVTAALLEPSDEPTTAYNREAAERVAHDLALATDVERIVDALVELGSATKKDAVVLKAQVKAQRGRACFDIAVSKGLIENNGTKNNPIYVVPPGGGGGRKEPKEGRDVGDVPVRVRSVPGVRDATGRRDDDPARRVQGQRQRSGRPRGRVERVEQPGGTDE